MRKKFEVALAQICCRVGDKKANLKLMERTVVRAKKKGAKIVVFPELSLTGYVLRDEIYGLAEPIPGPSVEVIEKIAEKAGVHIVFGMPEASQNAQATLHNVAVLVGPKGFVGKYRKSYLPTHSVFEEKRYFRPGYDVKVFDTELGKMGLMICYDIYFPEIARLARLHGAQLIICISASPSIRRGFFETLTAARAIENTAFLTFVNLVGVEDGLQFWGGSRLVGPNGRIIVQAKYDVEDLVVGQVDYSDLRAVEPFVPVLKDLRPEFFDRIMKAAEEI